MPPSESRLPDRGSVFTKDGEEWTVVDLTTRYVRLLGSTRTQDVPLWSWPAGFVSAVSDSDESDRTPIRALLVGGDVGKPLDRIEEMSKAQGVDIVAHWNGRLGRVPNKQIPAHVDVVIFLVSHIGHSLYETVRPIAVSSGIPVLHVYSQGYEAGLAKEMDRLGLRQKFGGTYELPIAMPAQGRYTWTGSTWSWEESEGPMLVDDGGGESVLATLLALGTIIGLAKS